MAIAKIIMFISGAAIIGFSQRKAAEQHLPVADTLKADSANWPKTFGLGRPATALEITAWDIDIRPDGKGLPPGSGTATEGKALYISKCAACHGADGKEVAGIKLPAPALVSDTTFKGRKMNTIGNYWPYATTIFDYIRRSMPYNSPGNLTDREVYSLTAYLLTANQIISNNAEINAQTLQKVIMPAQKYYITDDRKGGPEIK